VTHQGQQSVISKHKSLPQILL